MIRIPILLAVLTIAASSQTSSSSKNKPSARHATRNPTTTATAETLYRSPEFSFTYKIPYAWVDRTKDMQDDSTDPAKSRLLLAVFERPPQVTGDTVNSAVVITAESADSYPGLKTAADYMGPLTELTTSKGFKADGGPYEFPVGITKLVRGDFTRTVGSLAMHQSSLVMLLKGYVVSFTFIAGSDDELDELVEKLSFPSAKP
jgi:hypothetical protein